MAMYIIEHMEPKVWDWCFIEYKHMSKIVGKKNLVFSNTSSQKLKPYGTVTRKSVADLQLDKPCLLDPKAPKTLSPTDEFNTFIFGGILGDDPPQYRTKDLAFKLRKVPRRNLGTEQMSTDTAVLVTKKIVDGTPFGSIPFSDGIEINVKPGEAVHLPYRYIVEQGNPVLAPGLLAHLRKKGF